MPRQQSLLICLEGLFRRGCSLEIRDPIAVSPLEAGLVIFLTFFVMVFVSAAVLLTLGNEAALIVGELLIFIVPLFYLLGKHVDVKSYIKLNLSPKYVMIGLGCTVPLLLLNIFSAAILTTIFGSSQAVEESNALLLGVSSSPLGLVAVVVSLALAGICEEFALRGLLQNSLARRYSFLPAVLISAAVFGIFHYDPQFVYIIAAFFSGLALGAIYQRWGYAASATAHSVMNIVVLVFLMYGL